MKKLNVALVGLGFGGAFGPIYAEHPQIGQLVLCDTNEQVLKNYMDYMKNYTNVRACTSFDEILADKTIDAVHLVTPIPLHADQTVKVLEAGKHCACTVPMATSCEDIQRIADAVKKSGKKYMMMETTLYTYQIFYIKKMIANGEIGRIQFMRGSHYQDMANWPSYWMGLPPMWYGTHAIGPMVDLSGSRISKVSCLGSGTMEPWLSEQYKNPFPVESAHFWFENGMKAEATRSLFETARVYKEGLAVYGSNKSFEWGFSDGDNPIITTLNTNTDGTRGNWTACETMQMPNYYDDLPEEIRHFTVGGNYDPLNPQESLKVGAGAGHHGSHAHLVHEFMMSIIEDRKPYVDVALGGNITAAGLVAHESALRDGEILEVPEF